MSTLVPLLTYFDIRGRAEVIRLILEEVGVPYRERRVQEQDWATVKPSMPFGQMPLYEEGELIIPQSHAIYQRPRTLTVSMAPFGGTPETS